MPENAILLTHGAGSNREASLLVAVGKAFEDAGWLAERFDLPFRRQRPKGPPRPGDAARDREGLRGELLNLRSRVDGQLWAGGQSYGGRQLSILLSEDPTLADGLLLLSYPLHPPGKPTELRTAHLPQLRLPTVFVHGTRDPFGTIEELEAAIRLLPGSSRLLPVEGAGHGLAQGGASEIAKAVIGSSRADLLGR